MSDKCIEGGSTGTGRYSSLFSRDSSGRFTTSTKLSKLASKAARFAEIRASKSQAKRKLEFNVERPEKKEKMTRSVSVRLVLDCFQFVKIINFPILWPTRCKLQKRQDITISFSFSSGRILKMHDLQAVE